MSHAQKASERRRSSTASFPPYRLAGWPSKGYIDQMAITVSPLPCLGLESDHIEVDRIYTFLSTAYCGRFR